LEIYNIDIANGTSHMAQAVIYKPIVTYQTALLLEEGDVTTVNMSTKFCKGGTCGF